jgi:hypothetical protein
MPQNVLHENDMQGRHAKHALKTILMGFVARFSKKGVLPPPQNAAEDTKSAFPGIAEIGTA